MKTAGPITLAVLLAAGGTAWSALQTTPSPQRLGGAELTRIRGGLCYVTMTTDCPPADYPMGTCGTTECVKNIPSGMWVCPVFIRTREHKDEFVSSCVLMDMPGAEYCGTGTFCCNYEQRCENTCTQGTGMKYWCDLDDDYCADEISNARFPSMASCAGD